MTVGARRKHKGKWLRRPGHPDWRTSRDDFIIRVYGWGPMIDITRGFRLRFLPSYGYPDKYFAVRHYGSERAALNAARAHRDALLAQSGEPKRRNAGRRLAPYLVKLTKKNKSGIVGITLDRGAWVAWYHPSPRKQVRRSWSIKKYTDDGARQLAIMWRADMLRSLR